MDHLDDQGFEVNYKKIQNDRKILRKLDAELAQNAIPGVLGQILVFSVLIYPGGIHHEMPKVAIVSGFLLLMIAMTTIFLGLRFNAVYGAAPAKWRKRFVLLFYVNTIVWALLNCSVIINFKVSANTMLISLFSFGLGALSNINWAFYAKVMQRCLIISFVTASLCFLMWFSLVGVLLAFIWALSFWVLYRQSQDLYDRFWERIILNYKLRSCTRELKRAKEKLNVNQEIRYDFLSNLTREVRTPMNSLLGILSLLNDSEELSPHQRELLAVANHAGASLLGMMDDVLDFSKISAGEIVLDSVVFNLQKCVEEVLELLGPQAHGKGIELSAIFDREIPLRVRGDPGRLAQIIHSLVDNAIKFSHGGEVIVEIHMTRLSNVSGLLRIHVVDYGTGITTSQQKKLFKAFQKGNQSSHCGSNGTGLGLAICKCLVEKMQGTIGLISTEGEGSTFWFTACLRLSTQQKQTEELHPCFEGKNILIVDATDGMVTGLKNYLLGWGVTVESISGGYNKALQVLRDSAREDNAFDIVIMNMSMEYVGTFKLSSILANDPVLSQVKQVILTSLKQRSLPETLHHARQIPQLVFCSKPVQKRMLFQALSSLYSEVAITDRLTEGFDLQQPLTEHYKILLVEDNKVNQMVAKGILNRLGYSVTTVDNGKDALEIIADKQFDLVLMDCLMPKMDGYQTTQAIRNKEKLTKEHLLIIAMTASAMDGEEAQCLAVGMDDYLAKPVNAKELDTKLRLWLERKQRGDGIIFSDQSNSLP